MVIPYLFYNWVTQAHIVPLSGRVKLFYMHLFYPHWQDYIHSNEWHGLFFAFTKSFWLLKQPNFFVASTLVVLLIIIGQLIVWRNHTNRLFPVSIKILGVIVAVHIVFMQFVYRELRPKTDYYFAAEVLWIGLVLGHYAGTGFSRPRDAVIANKNLLSGLGVDPPRIVAVLAAIYVAFTSWTTFEIEPSSYWVQRVNLADDIQQLFPANQSKIGAIWPGALAQFSEKRVIPLDGIIGSNEYFEAYVKTGRQFDHLLEQPQALLAVYLPVSPSDLSPKTPSRTNPWNLNVEYWLASRESSFEVLASRPVNAEGAGWYLLELEAAASETATSTFPPSLRKDRINSCDYR
jgi:hypothetical protein